MPKFRTQYDEKYNAAIFATDVGDPDDNLVQHSMQEECDVNYIMSLYQRTGELHHVQSQSAMYGDFSDVLDYQEGLHRIMEADSLFMELPAKVRDRFDNDPAKFLDFATNPDNLEEMRKMGLAPPAQAPAAPEAPEPPSSEEA